MVKLMRGLSVVLAALLLLAGVYANEAVDLERSDCSLTVVMKYGGRPVTGGSFTLYRVGSIVENGGDYGFELRPELNCRADTESILSEKAAGEVSDCVKRQKLPGVTVETDEKGAAVFSSLTAGLYLVKQHAAAPGFSLEKPFLVSVPQWDGEHYLYDITASSKTELHRFPDTPEKPDSPVKPDVPSDPKLPQTGQLNWPVPALLVLGGILLVTGLVMRKKNDA